jgi:hypothetical protein
LVKKYKKYYKNKMTIRLLEKTITKINDIIETKNVRNGNQILKIQDILNTNVIVEKMEELLNKEFQDLLGMVVLNVQKRKLQMK